MVGSDEDDPGGCGRLLPILRTAVGRGLRGSFVGRRGARPLAGSEARRFSPSRVDVLRAFPRASGGAGLMGRQRGAASTVLAKTAFSARGRRRPGKVVSLRYSTFSRAPPGCGCGGGNESLSLSLSSCARSARFFREVDRFIDF